jgi:hypothetical protein
MSEVPFDRPTDPLYRGAWLQYKTELPVLGVPVQFETNSGVVLAAIEAVYGKWRQLDTNPELCSNDRRRIRLFVQDGEESARNGNIPWLRMPDPNRLLISTGGSFGVVEVDRGEGYAFITSALVSHEARFHEGMLEPLTLMLVTGPARHPLHAATVARDGIGILLVGPSGSGKSTLAYAALRGGFTVLGEEIAYVQLEPELRVWGMPGRLRLVAEAAKHFPELYVQQPGHDKSGQNKVTVELGWGNSPAPPIVKRAAVCLLGRATDRAFLEPVSRSEIEEALCRDLEPGFDRDVETSGRVAACLAAKGGWRLHLSGNPEESVSLLERVVAEFA